MGGYFWDGVLWNLMMDGLWKDGWAMERWMGYGKMDGLSILSVGDD
jgi:hypothetical protein